MADANSSPSIPSESILPESQPVASETQQLDSTTQESTLEQSNHINDTSMSDATARPTQDPSDADLDASLAAENGNEALATSNMNLDGPTDTQPDAALPAVIPPEPSAAMKKDSTLRAFLNKSEQYTPLIPDAVTDYYLTLAGLPPPPETDRRLARLFALATQKFIADIAADAYQYSRIRSTNTTSNNPLTGLGGAAGFGMAGGAPGAADGEAAGKKGKEGSGKSAPLGGPRAGYGGGGSGAAQGRTVLTMEDLGMAVGEYGINVKRGEFYR